MTGTALPHPATRTTAPLLAEVPIVAAAVVNVALLLVGSAADGAMAVQWPVAQPLSAPIVAAASLVPTTIGLVVTWAVGRRRAGFVRFARWAGVVVAVGSMAAALIGGDDLATRLSLAPMHLVVAVAWLLATRSLSRRR